MPTTAEDIPSDWGSPIVLSRTFTRDGHTLLFFKAWDTSEATLIYPWYDKTVKNLLFMGEKDSNKVSIF